MTLRQIAIIIALGLAAGCTMQTADVSRLAGADAGLAAPAATPVSVTAANIGQLAARSGDAYLIGRGDVLQVRAIDAPELTAPSGYEVEPNGAITLPFLGRVPAAEREIAEIRDDIRQRLEPYLPDPQVDLRITEFNARHISVVGEVNRPNRQTLTTRPLSVIDAINAAGGFTTDSGQRRVVILRDGREIPVDIDGFLSQGRALPTLRDGDVVQVTRARWGQTAPSPQGVVVQMPGQPERSLDPGAGQPDVAQVLAGLGASGMQAQVIRASGAGDRVYHLDAENASDPAVGGRFTLHDGDRLILQPVTR